MNWLSLLDKQEKIELEIFQFYYLQEKPVPLSVFVEQKGYSKKISEHSFRRVMGATGKSFDVVWKIHPEGILLTIGSNFDLKTLEYQFLADSINYKILEILYNQGKIDFTDIAETLYLSQASYYRRIKQINMILQEFLIKIDGGLMTGEEHQIRQFYFQLFWNGRPLEQTIQSNNDPEISFLMNLIQKQIEVEFTPFEYHKFFPWLRITKRRIRSVNRGTSKVIEKFLPEIMTHPLYRKLRLLFLRYLSRYTIKWNEYEAAFIFLFIQAANVIPYQSPIFEQYYQKFPSSSVDSGPMEKQLQQMNQHAFDRFCQVTQQEEYAADDRKLIIYTINQINWYIFFFQGAFIYFAEENLLALETTIPQMNVNVKSYQLIVDNFQYLERNFSDNSLPTLLALRFAALLAYFIKDAAQPIKVKVDFYCDRLIEKAIVYYLRDFLSLSQADLYTDGETAEFDLIITNLGIKYRNLPKEKIFILNEFLSFKDLEEIRQQVRRLYREKNAMKVVKEE